MIERIEWNNCDDPTIIAKPDTFVAAWSLCGGDGKFQIRGGRTIYESIGASTTERTDRVRLMRLDTSRGLSQIDRWIDPDTEIEVIEVDVWTAHFAGLCGRVRWTADGVPYVDEVDADVPGRFSDGASR
jgi:hypothetical protein